MRFNEIKPFVRYIQRLKITRAWADRTLVPRDNRLFYCLLGCGLIDVGEERYEMTRGGLLLIPAGTPYILHIPERDVTYVSVNFDYVFTRAELSRPVGPVSPEEFEEKGVVVRSLFSNEPLLNEPMYIENLTALEDILSPMVVVYNKKLLYYELELSGMMTEVITTVLRARKLGDLTEPDSAIAAILSYIHNNYAEKLTNSGIGEMFGYNTNYVSDLIKSATNQPLHKYIESVRVERAAELLTTSELPVGRIAELCGFSDIFHFSKTFRSRMGSTPTAYRKSK